MGKALLIGINKYQLPGNDLQGCINDVQDLRSILINFYGYADGDIKVITDGQATKRGMLDGLQWLVTTGDPNLILHFSGHGTQTIDSIADESDRLDEALCPSDVLDQNGLVTDDQIAGYINQAPLTTKFTFIADCCHSGTVNRVFAIGNPVYRKARYMSVPNNAVPNKPTRRYVKNLGGVRMSLLLSGCRDDQTSADAIFGNRPNGALTYFLLSILRANPKISWRQAHAKVIGLLSRNRFDQVPQLSGPSTMISSPVFS